MVQVPRRLTLRNMYFQIHINKILFLAPNSYLVSITSIFKGYLTKLVLNRPLYINQRLFYQKNSIYQRFKLFYVFKFQENLLNRYGNN